MKQIFIKKKTLILAIIPRKNKDFKFPFFGYALPILFKQSYKSALEVINLIQNLNSIYLQCQKLFHLQRNSLMILDITRSKGSSWLLMKLHGTIEKKKGLSSFVDDVKRKIGSLNCYLMKSRFKRTVSCKYVLSFSVTESIILSVYTTCFFRIWGFVRNLS